MMDVKEYLLKVKRICQNLDIECEDCPLQNYDCGNPTHVYSEESRIDKVIDIVENYKLEEG